MYDLNSVLNERYRAVSLKPLSRRLRNLQKKRGKRQPDVYLVTAESGARYKWLRAGAGNADKLARIVDLYEALKHLDFIPRMIWHDERNILFKYVEGPFADLDSSEFAMSLGGVMARLFLVEQQAARLGEQASGTAASLEYLEKTGLVSAALKDRVAAAMESARDVELLKGFVYADCSKPGNYVVGAEGRLFLIDLGGFQGGRLLGEALFGSPLWSRIDRESFRRGYAAAGGPEQIFGHEQLLRLSRAIAMAEFNHRQIGQLPFTACRKKRNRMQYTREYIEQMDRLTADPGKQDS